MGRIISAATLLRQVKADLAQRNRLYLEALVQRDAFRVRATKAEQEAAEWKVRFDLLLRRDDKTITAITNDHTGKAKW